MTKDEQSQINELACQVAHFIGAMTEARTATDKRLDSIDANVAVIRTSQLEHIASLARIPPTCAAHAKILDELTHCVARLQEHDQEYRDAHSEFHADELTPPPYDIAARYAAAAAQTHLPRAEQTAAPKETFWAWLHSRASALTALLALLGVLGGVTFWMFKTYNSLQAMQDFVVRASDGGFVP
jgi:hypothetical protein